MNLADSAGPHNYRLPNIMRNILERLYISVNDYILMDCTTTIYIKLSLVGGVQTTGFVEECRLIDR